MKIRPFFVKIFSLHIFSLFIIVFVSMALTVNAISDMMYKKTEKELEDVCMLVCNMFPADHVISLYDAEALCLQAAAGTGIRLTLIQYSGSVLADSVSNYRNMTNHFDRPEIIDAFTHDIGHSIRRSETLGIDMMYGAVSIPSMSFIIRASIPLKEVNSFIHRMYDKIVPFVCFILLLITLFVYFFCHGIDRSISSITNVTRRYASGDFSSEVAIDDAELSDLGQAVNYMGQELKSRFDVITARKEQVQNIINNMINPLIVVDEFMQVRELNSAAKSLKGGNPADDFSRKNLSDVIDSESILKMVRRVFDEKGHKSVTVCTDSTKNIYYYVNISFIDNLSLRDRRGNVLIIINDITGIKRLDNMRREFAVNVSHELKTPVTSILGYVDTLLGIYDEHPEKVVDFLKIIKKQSVRLSCIIEDLLLLSRTDDTYVQLEKEMVDANELSSVCLNSVSEMASSKHITLKCDNRGVKTILVHPVLAEQAVNNLLNNAVKYSGDGADVILHLENDGDYVVISVEDNGPGIKPEHLPNIFNRFYRENKEISRSLGGTGLGLSIVKQVAETHGGKVAVESTEGSGSVFRIYFPV